MGLRSAFPIEDVRETGCALLDSIFPTGILASGRNVPDALKRSDSMRRLAFGGALALGATALWCFLPLPAFFGSSEVLRRDPASLANVSPEARSVAERR